MRKTFITTILMASAMLCPIGGSAQNAERLAKPGTMRLRTQLKNLLPSTKTVTRLAWRTPLRAVDESTTIWGNLKSDYQWGYYSFHPTSEISFTTLGKLSQHIAKNGVQIADGKLYAVNFDRYGVGSGELTLYTYDLTTWEGTSAMYDSFNLAALETAQATDGTVYGEFYNAVASKEMYELGTVDYRTRKRTTFGYTTKRYVAMGITSDNVLYGIAEDGKLYKISTTDGTATLIGSTGISLTDDWGGPYDQTGEIDQKDNTFYWYAQDADYDTGLYTVDLSTGAATKIAACDATMYGMIIPLAAADNGVPSAATNLKATFEGTSLTGNVEFSIPTQSADGNELHGSVSYVLTANGEEVAKGTAAAGTTAKEEVTVSNSGSYTFAVTLSNDKGSSSATTIEQWVGYDEPGKVNDLVAKFADGVVNISWTAPTSGTHGGTIDNLLYDVVRINGNDSTKVATNITETACTDNISEEQLSTYTYAVRAINGDMSGKWTNSASLLAGAAIEPDWNYTFEGYTALSLFTVIDGNGDRNTWWANGVKGYGAMSNQQRATATSDDWLITPPLHLTSDRVYTVSFKVRNMMDAPLNTLEVRYGKGNTADDMTQTLLETFKPKFSETNGEWQVCTADIMPSSDGVYYIGFHDNTTAADKYQVAIDNISVKKTAYTAAPDSVTDLTIIPAAKGALSATISFVAPTLTLNGNKLQKVDHFGVQCDGQIIGDIPGTDAGNNVTWTDNKLTDYGFHTYTITPYLNDNPGRENSARAYIGIDKPKNPKGVTFADMGTSLTASWNEYEEQGANGGYINPSTVKMGIYNLENNGFGYELGSLITESKPGETSVGMNVDPNVTTMPDGKTQTLAWFAAMASNEAGQSDYVRARGVVIGPNIELPFKESFKGGMLDNGFASLLGNDQYNSRQTSASWRVVTDDASDNDGGSLVWANYSESYGDSEMEYTIIDGDETSVNMPKVTLAGSTRAKLFFDLNSLVGNEASLQVLVQTPDGSDEVVAEYDLTKTNVDGWSRKAVDLSKFASERYIIVKFNGVAHGSKVLIGVDNVNIIDQLDRNIAANSISVPQNVVAGKTAKVKVTVQNLGALDANSYGVELYANDKVVDKVTVEKSLTSLANDTIVLSLPVAINEQAKKLSVKAKVAYDGDQLEGDNETESKDVNVKQSAYGSINSLEATSNTDGDVTLTWGMPILPEPERVTEGFEGFSPFSQDLSPWTLVDADKGTAGALQPSATYPGQGEAFAFLAFNPDWWMEDMTQTNPGLTPYDGEQYAAAIYAKDENGKLVAQDNWMISPRLSGRKQTVSFYVMNIAAYSGDKTYAESFDVLYSTTGKDTEDFVKLSSEQADGTNAFSEGANWKRITVELPEGARYFAIHHNTPSANSYVFGIDDVNYEQLATGADDKITEYVIYKDGKELARTNGDNHSYTDNSREGGTHVYNVTVIYTSDNGETNESGFSNDATVAVSAIAELEKDGASLNVTTIDGMRMRTGAKNLDGLKRNVYIVNGKKITVR